MTVLHSYPCTKEPVLAFLSTLIIVLLSKFYFAFSTWIGVAGTKCSISCGIWPAPKAAKVNTSKQHCITWFIILIWWTLFYFFLTRLVMYFVEHCTVFMHIMIGFSWKDKWTCWHHDKGKSDSLFPHLPWWNSMCGGGCSATGGNNQINRWVCILNEIQRLVSATDVSHLQKGIQGAGDTMCSC